MSVKKAKKQKQKKKWKVFPLLFLVIFVFGALWLFTIFSEYKNQTDIEGEKVTINISPGSGIRDIAAVLKENDLIRHKAAFYLKVKTMDAAGELKYGTFTLEKGYCLETLIENLIEGGEQKAGVWFTVPEGFTIEKIGAKLEEEGFCSQDDFLAAVEEEYDYDFLDSIPSDADVTYRLQGFLFPDTYEMEEGITPREIVITMLDQFGAQYTDEMEERTKELGKTIFEVVTEASIIERETDQEDERAVIAGVIENRLKADMPLQMCPTVLYPLTNGMYDVTTVTYEDTKLDSPYNTYVNKGLPPGPIASPGIACINAALNPASHNYFFYHTDEEKNDGSHIFTETYEEHVETQK
ncbi:MAG: endolytic transglycosylase MltG [Lachnospiraceae bacterium]|nr:endolytic transglycosylase MltG [Lachnospiraceae bacterium]